MSGENSFRFQVIVIGAGAAGLMAAAIAGARGRKVALLEHTDKIGEKIRISGGGRCNFTNLHTSDKNYLSSNPHFCKSALAAYTQFDFIDLVKKHGIAFHEKTLGQLFCDGSSMQIIQMLTKEAQLVGVSFFMNTSVKKISHNQEYCLETTQGLFYCDSLIIATGGLAVPKIGATGFGYDVARQFGLKVIDPTPALVPLSVPLDLKNQFKDLVGISQFVRVSLLDKSFEESMLFTHHGLSGPSILQISSYLRSFPNKVRIDFFPAMKLEAELMIQKNSKQQISTFLKQFLTNRFVDYLENKNPLIAMKLTDIRKKDLQEIARALHEFTIEVDGTLGYQKAEVTYGGVDTKELSSKNMSCLKMPSLFFIGEVVDVTGWLGGFNFQWAWSSGYVAGKSA